MLQIIVIVRVGGNTQTLENRFQALTREGGILAITGTGKAHNQTVAHQLVTAHAADIGQIFDPVRLSGVYHQRQNEGADPNNDVIVDSHA